MQNQKLKDFVLISVPFEVWEEANISPNALMQYHAEDGKIIMEMVDEVLPIVCEENCEECPVKGMKMRQKTEEVTLMEFLNNLSVEQQRAALIHLSVMMAQNMQGDLSF